VACRQLLQPRSTNLRLSVVTRGLDNSDVSLSLYLLSDDVPRSTFLPIGFGPPWPFPGGQLDPMRGDVHLAELPRPQRLMLLEKVVHGTAERTGDTVPVDLRLGTRLIRRVRRGFSLVDPLPGLPARLETLVGLVTEIHPHRENRPRFLYLLDDVQWSIVGRCGSDDVPLGEVHRHIPDVVRLRDCLVSGENSATALCNSTFPRLIWTGRSRTRWTPLTLQHTWTAWMHCGPTVTPCRSRIPPTWAFGFFPRRWGAGRVFPVRLRIATVDVPSSRLIVCVLGEMVSTYC